MSKYRDVGPRGGLSNCRWVNIKTQCNNRTTNVIVTINGETHNIKEWSEITGIKYATIYQRIKRGLTGVDIIKEVKSTWFQKKPLKTKLRNF